MVSIENQGQLSNEVLLEYQTTKQVVESTKTEVIKENGSFKDNIKLTFSYEFLLRLTHNGVKAVIPQTGYKHVNFREGSLFWNYKNDEDWKLKTKENTILVRNCEERILFQK